MPETRTLVLPLTVTRSDSLLSSQVLKVVMASRLVVMGTFWVMLTVTTETLRLREVDLGEGRVRLQVLKVQVTGEGVDGGADAAGLADRAVDGHGEAVRLRVGDGDALHGQGGRVDLLLGDVRDTDKDAMGSSQYIISFMAVTADQGPCMRALATGRHMQRGHHHLQGCHA